MCRWVDLVHRVTKSQTQLSDWTTTIYSYIFPFLWRVHISVYWLTSGPQYPKAPEETHVYRHSSWHMTVSPGQNRSIAQPGHLPHHQKTEDRTEQTHLLQPQNEGVKGEVRGTLETAPLPQSTSPTTVFNIWNSSMRKQLLFQSFWTFINFLTVTASKKELFGGLFWWSSG